MGVLPLETGITYGPVTSRRLGVSLGINVLPLGQKVCSFDCVYCHYGRTTLKTMAADEQGFPGPTLVMAAVEKALRLYRQVDALTFSGNGEPTLHPYFADIAYGIRRLRDRLAPQAKVALFSNATTAAHPRIQAALAHIDLPIMKLDAGDPETFGRIDRPAPGVTLEAVIAGLKQVRGCILQSVLIDGEVSNIHGAPFEAWVHAIAEIQPARVQIYSTDYPVAEVGVQKVPPFVLKRIAEEVKERTGVQVDAYWAELPSFM